MNSLRSLRYMLTHNRAAKGLGIAFAVMLLAEVALFAAVDQLWWGPVWPLIGLVVIGVTGIALVGASEGYRPVTAQEYDELLQKTWTHRSRQLVAAVGVSVILDPSYTRYRSRMKRSDRLRPSRRQSAVYFATTDGGGVAQRANGVYRATTILIAGFDHHRPPARKHCYLRTTGDLAVTTPVHARVIEVLPSSADSGRP